MERWSGKIAVVTGASSGIGWAVVKDLTAAGMTVVGLARRLNRMDMLKLELDPVARGCFHPRACDISSLDSIKLAFQWIEEKFKRVHVLVNNAGIMRFTGILTEGNEEGLRELVDVNILGLVYSAKEAYRLMKIAMNNGEECHLINVNSILGHTIPSSLASLTYNLYPTSKHALKATNEVLRQELVHEKLIRISVSIFFTKSKYDI